MRFVREFELKDKSRKWGLTLRSGKYSEMLRRPLSSVSAGECWNESPQELCHLIQLPLI